MNWTAALPGYAAALAAIIMAIVALRRAKPDAEQLRANAEATLSDAATRFGIATAADRDKIIERLRAVEDHQREQDKLLAAHEVWDRQVTTAAARVGLRLPKPPPLRATAPVHPPRTATA